MKRIRNSLNYEVSEDSFEINSGVKVTVPDQSMSLRTILDRFARGLPLGVGVNVPVYGSDDPEMDEWPDPRTMDISERQEFAKEVINSRRKKQKDEENKSKKEAGDVRPAAGGERAKKEDNVSDV